METGPRTDATDGLMSFDPRLLLLLGGRRRRRRSDVCSEGRQGKGVFVGGFFFFDYGSR